MKHCTLYIQVTSVEYGGQQLGFAPRQNMGQGGSGMDTLRKMTEVNNLKEHPLRPLLWFFTSRWLFQITISQRMSATEIITGCDTRNKYDLYQHESQVLFTAREESECMDRCFCGPIRYIDITSD